MARIRTIKPDFFRHAKLYKAEQETGLPLRVAFAGLWTAADREGRFRWQPDELKLDCLPYDALDFSRVLHALATRGFLVVYEIAGELFCHIPSWRAHQFINNKEKASNIPAPTKESIDSMTPERVLDASESREGRVSEVGVKGRGKEGERKGREVKEKQSKTASPPAPNDVDPQVWADWLKVRKGKNAAFTETTVKEIRAEAKKAGMSFEDALRTCCKRTWTSFEASWLTNGKKNGSHKPAIEERNQQHGEEWLRRHKPPDREPEIFDAIATERSS